MSWLLIALIPGLLMLATFGLDRVESSLRSDVISTTNAAKFVDQASDLPTHQYFHAGANPEFQQTRQMNPV